MLRNLLHKKDDEGFTLIELLVVILIIGILAAIALPTFLGQSDKAKDASAKSDVRNAVSQIESCMTDAANATAEAACASLTGNPDLKQFNLLSAASGTSSSSYSVTAKSKASTGGDHTYTITKSTPGYSYTASTGATGREAWASNGVQAP